MKMTIDSKLLHYAGTALAFGWTLCAPAIDFENAWIVGSTPNDQMFFKPGEEIAFTLNFHGVKNEEFTPGEYHVEWTRRGEDGVTEKGTAPVPFPKGGLVLKTKMMTPGFFFLDAVLVDKNGKRQFKQKQRWEKRILFTGGAGVMPETLEGCAEPRDFDSFWKRNLADLAKVPCKGEMKEVATEDKKIRAFAVRIDCVGPRPVTGYLTMPADASPAKRYPISVNYRGASHDNLPPPKTGPHNLIRIEVTVQGFDLGKDDNYIKEFFKSIEKKGYGYGMAPEDNNNRDTCYWKWVILRAVRALEWMHTRPEWDGKTFEVCSGSQGAWQSVHAAALYPHVTRLSIDGTWGCDWYGQDTVTNRIRSSYRPRCSFPAMAYFDPVIAASRVLAPTAITFAGLGDACSTPTSLSVLYNNLRVPKCITYYQGNSHGWRPSGMATKKIDGGYDRCLKARNVCADPIAFIKNAVARGEKNVKLPKAQYWLTVPAGTESYLTLSGLKDVTVDFGGSEFVGTFRTRMLTTYDCTNCVFKNLTIDYATLPFIQGVITRVDKNKNWDIEVIDGYPLPKPHDNVWPLQAYDSKTHELSNPMRFNDGLKIVRTGPRTCRAVGGIDRRGKVGDIAVWSACEKPGTYQSCAQWAVRCVECRFEDITEYSTPMGCAYRDYFGDAETYLRCKVIRRPPEIDLFPRGLKRLRSGNHDANMHRGAIRGPRIIDCVSKYHCDDCVNIGGMFGVITRQEGNKARVVFNYLGPSIDAGDECESVDPKRKRLPNVKAISVGKVQSATKADIEVLEKAAKLWPGLANSCRTATDIVFERPIGVGGFAISTRHQGNGFLVQGCDFGHNRARGLLLSASNGAAISNRIEAASGSAIVEAGPSFLWMEGGFSKNIRYEGNNANPVNHGDKTY